MTVRTREFLAACAALQLLTGSARAEEGAGQSAAVWPDTLTTRVEALALLETLNADLLSNDSATLTLDRWCDAHKMATPAKTVAELVHGDDTAPPEEVRQLLGVSSTDPVRYRHVRLHCGAHVLSEADNWYVPARLTPDMNHLLDTTDTAFGRAVQTLHFHRRTLSAKLLWSPLPQGWEMGAATAAAGKGPLQIPTQTIQHRAWWSRPTPARFSTSRSRRAPSSVGLLNVAEHPGWN
jgi:chorismate-pyruvate lyase